MASLLIMQTLIVIHVCMVLGTATPTVEIYGTRQIFMSGKEYKLQCNVSSHLESIITWNFKNCKTSSQCVPLLTDATPFDSSTESTSLASKINEKTFTANKTHVLVCKACNKLGCREDRKIAIVSDVPGGMRLTGTPKQNDIITLGDKLSLECAMPKYNCSSKFTWEWEPSNSDNDKILITKGFIDTHTEYSWFSKLTISSVENSGLYFCTGECDAGPRHLSFKLKPKQPIASRFHEEHTSPINISRIKGQDLILNCSSYGLPRPTITWFKDSTRITVDKNTRSSSVARNTSEDNDSLLNITSVDLSDEGSYTCNVKNRINTITRSYNVVIIKDTKMTEIYIVLVIIICVVLVVIVFYLARRVKREKRKVRSLTVQDVRIFLEGAVDSIDPDLGLDEQADLLPYNKDYEIPRGKIKLGRQLGSGAFGRVVKAEVDGPLFGADSAAFEFDETDPHETNKTVTTVAVKMVKPHAEVSQVKALMTELKILIHVGKHLNVVNLLGACTTNLVKKELLVIVEYCRYGNLHSLLLRRRDNFVDQVDHTRETIDFSIAVPVKEEKQVNFSHYKNAVVFTAKPTCSSLQETVACSKNELSHITTKDLVCWSYQVALGMEYLAFRKVVHADLAARNMLLAENNIVKICDFGLSRNLYKDSNYFKKSEDPLPVKWMSIESIRDRVFSTQSDVWSFGVVLWEFFTLARTPYPGVQVDEHFLPRLLDGHRMEKPQLSTSKLYHIMRKCWEETPSSRPTFPDLVITLGQMIEHDDKEVYGDMNAPYLRMNASRPDYLIMRRLSQNLNSLEQNDLQIRRSGDCPSKSVLDNNTTHGKMIV